MNIVLNLDYDFFYKAGSQTWEGSSPASVCWPSFDSWGPVRYSPKELYGATLLWANDPQAYAFGSDACHVMDWS